MKKIILVFILTLFQFSYSQSIQEKREKLIEIYNEGFRKFKGKKGNLFRSAYAKDHILIITIKINLNLRRIDVFEYENKALSNMSYGTARFILDGREIIKFIADSGFTLILFDTEINYSDGRKGSKQYYLPVSKLKDVSIPITEPEFNNILW